MATSIILLTIGFVLLIRGADKFVDSAVQIAHRFHIPPIIIGTTLVAIGTSAPEATISIIAALRGATGVSIGNVLGSNITNIFLILGLTAIIGRPIIQNNTKKYELPFMGIITLLVCFIGLWFGEISRTSALVFLILFVAFIVYNIITARKAKNTPENITTVPWHQVIVMIFAGIAAIVIGGDLIVDSATNIALRFGVSERVIGLTLVALGTSLPELVVSVTAAIKHQYDMAVGNVVGSNIFNILFVLGLAAFIRPMPFAQEFISDGAIAMLAVIILMIFTAKNARLNRGAGITFVTAYLAYIAYLIA